MRGTREEEIAIEPKNVVEEGTETERNEALNDYCCCSLSVVLPFLIYLPIQSILSVCPFVRLFVWILLVGHLDDFNLEAEFGTHGSIRRMSGGQKVRLV
jgi:hypothetical protein